MNLVYQFFAAILMCAGLVMLLAGGHNWDTGRRGAALADLAVGLFLAGSGFWLAVYP